MQENPPVVIPPSVPSVFNFEGKDVRVVEIDGEPWFVAADVCPVLGIVWKGTAATLPAIPDAWRRVSKVQTTLINQHGTFGEQEKDVVVINEAAYYKLAFRSNKPEAETFTNFIASDVIPSVRKTGSYVVANPATLPAVSTDPLQLFLITADAVKHLAEKTVQLESRTAQVEDIALDTAAKVEYIENSRGLETWQAYAIKQEMGTKVYELHEKYGINRGMLFSASWGFLKRYFKVPTYSAIPSKRFEEALMVVKNLTLEQLPPTIIELARGTKRTAKAEKGGN